MFPCILVVIKDQRWILHKRTISRSDLQTCDVTQLFLLSTNGHGKHVKTHVIKGSVQFQDILECNQADSAGKLKHGLLLDCQARQ